MFPSRSEPTICEVLSDPLIGAVMRADRVTPGDIEAMLTTLAQRQVDRRLHHAGSPASSSCVRRAACEF